MLLEHISFCKYLHKSNLNQISCLTTTLLDKIVEAYEHFVALSIVLIKLVVNRFSFITGSYDRTCKVWDTATGEELQTLEGHRNVVYAIAFNNPYG